MVATDVIELLLRGASEQRRDMGRKWTALMRMLIDDARAFDGGRVSVSLDRATGAFESHVTEELRKHLFELLRVFLSAALESTGAGEWFLPVGGRGVPASNWAGLQEYRAERPWLAEVPAPGESALEVASRLQVCLERLVPLEGEGRSEVELWRARLLFAEARHDLAVQHLEAQLGLFAGPGDRVRLVAGLVTLQLERGAVLLAAATLEDHSELSLADEGLLELRARTALLKGNITEATSIRALLPRGRPSLPQTLVELKARVPSWAALLPGRVETAGIERREVNSLALGRGAIGAAFLGVFRPIAGSAPQLLRSELSPGWRRRLEAWLGDRDGARDTLGCLEQDVVATARVCVVHRAAGESLNGVLGAGGTLALALCPLLDANGEVRAWLHLEFEHHLVPTEKALEALAQAWQVELAAELPDETELRVAGEDGEWSAGVEAPGDDPRAEFFHDFADALGMKTAQRRWWGFVFEGKSSRWIATGGGALAEGGQRAGGGHCLSRVRRCGVPIRFDEPDSALSLHGAAASGVAFPLLISGRTVGCFVVESERRRDFRREDLDRYGELAVVHAPRLRTSAFRAWHRDRYGADLFFDVHDAGFGRRALDSALAGRVDDAVALSGPAGCGKEVLARRLHFERAGGAGEFEVLRCGAMPDRELEDALRRAYVESQDSDSRSFGTLLIKDLPALPPKLQGLLLHMLERPTGKLRTVVTLATSLEQAVSNQSLFGALGHKFGRLELFVPPLSDRRGEIPGIIEFATKRFSAQLGVPTPSWNDAAVALLWRQPWLGNVRELENLVYKLVLLHPGEVLEVEHIRQLARRFRFTLLKRLPSRHPRAIDLLTALRITRKRSGNPNKTRAALYLGWDPDTLVSRLRDAQIDIGNPPDEWVEAEAQSGESQPGEAAG